MNSIDLENAERFRETLLKKQRDEEAYLMQHNSGDQGHQSPRHVSDEIRRRSKPIVNGTESITKIRGDSHFET